MRPHVIVLCTAFAAAAGVSSHAAPLPATTPAALPLAPVASASAVLAKGTSIRLRLETDLRSGRDKTGEPVLFTVAQNVYGPGHTLLLTKGALARGRVTESAGHGALGRAGRLTFTCDYARTDDGALIPLGLVVSPGSIKTSSESIGEIGASVSTGARGYSYPPGGYYGGYPGGYPGGYYQQSGVSGDVSADLGRVLAGGEDVTVSRGQQYDARVIANTSLAPALPASPPTQLFTLKDRTQVVAALAAFDGQNYTVTTLAGSRSIQAADVRSIQAISSVPLP